MAPIAHPGTPASESRQLSWVSKLSPRAEGDVLKIFIFPLCHPPESYTTHTELQGETAVTWKVKCNGEK